MNIGLDATYGVGPALSGVGVYSSQLIRHLAGLHPDDRFLLSYRMHRLRTGLREPAAPNCRRTLLTDYGPVGRFDLFHGLNQRLPTRRLSRSVVTFHDLFVMTAEYSTPEFRARFTEQARRAASNADLIIAVSEFTAGQVRDLLGVEPARLRVVHHGATPPAVPVPETPREPLILTVGAVQKRKNLVRLIEAFEQTPREWRLVIAGATTGYAAEETLTRIEHSPRREQILVTGYVSAPELESLYARASVFAFPSLDEGFGMPVLDAMLRGVPVLASKSSAVPEVAGAAALITDAQDAAALAAGLARLCTDSNLRKKMTAEGRARAAQFTWEAASRRTWAVYCELVA